MRRVAFALLLTACGGGGDDPPAGTPSCAPGEVAWTGRDPVSTGSMTDPLAYRFVNKLGAGDGRLEVDYAEGRLILEWQLFVADGDESPAQGVVDQSASGGGAFGNCLTTGIYPGIIHVGAGGASGWFDLGNDIRSGPDGCGGELPNTYAVGCFAAPPDDPR